MNKVKHARNSLVQILWGIFFLIMNEGVEWIADICAYYSHKWSKENRELYVPSRFPVYSSISNDIYYTM